MKALSKAAVGAVAASLIFCGMTFAKSHEISFAYRAQIGKHLQLQPGSYNLKVDITSHKPRAEFYQNGKLVGRARVKLVSEGQKIGQTQIDYSSPEHGVRRVTQIELNGWQDKLVFKKS